MFWFSAIITGTLTIYAWRTAQEMKGDVESAGLRKAYLATAICGAVGTLCFVAAALI
jgi:hypothetical protein